jgi:L-arabonate dehydrase
MTFKPAKWPRKLRSQEWFGGTGKDAIYHHGWMKNQGMAEVGDMELPAKLLKAGVRDVVRIPDARMSGTAYGTVVLHVAPEAAAGGPLAIVQNGDMVELDVPSRRLHLDISDDELAARLAQWTPPVSRPTGGYAQLYHDKVNHADEGADFDFLIGRRGNDVARESH